MGLEKAFKKEIRVMRGRQVPIQSLKSMGAKGKI